MITIMVTNGSSIATPASRFTSRACRAMSLRKRPLSGVANAVVIYSVAMVQMGWLRWLSESADGGREGSVFFDERAAGRLD